MSADRKDGSPINLDDKWAVMAETTTSPSTWQDRRERPIDVAGAVKKMKPSEMLARYDRHLSGGRSLLEPGDDFPNYLRMVTKFGFFNHSALIREGNRPKGKVVALGIELTHEPSGSGMALIINEQGAVMQIGQSEVLPINEDILTLNLQREYDWRLSESNFRKNGGGR